MEWIFSYFPASLLRGNAARIQHFDIIIIFEEDLSQAFWIIFWIENRIICVAFRPKNRFDPFLVRFTLGKNLSLVWHVKSVSSKPTFWNVVTWHNMVPKDKLQCSWLDSLRGKIFHLFDMRKVFHFNQHFEMLLLDTTWFQKTN